jgi:Zn-dependent protease with chaperone function
MRAPGPLYGSAAVGVLLPCLAVALLIVAPSHAADNRRPQPVPAGGDPPAFLLASVQPIEAPKAWRRIYHEVERCAGKTGDYDAIRWAVMEAPLHGPKGPTYAFTSGSRIVLVRDDTTYLRHEMLHHVLEVAGWHPRPLQPGEHYTIADLHPMPLFELCTGGR